MLTGATRDGRWIVFSPQLPHQAHALIKVLELDWMLDDERFKDMPSFWTLEDAGAWEETIFERLKERDLDAWVERGRANDDLPFEPLLSAEEALDHPQVRANGNVVTVKDDRIGLIEEIGPIGNFSLTPSVIQRSAPNLGEHGPLPEASAAPSGQSGALPRHALEGITIVEFGYFYAMPFGIAMAGALGARIIKIENLEGDPMRWSFGAPEWGATKTMEGKESICLNLRTDEGRRVVHELLRRADVFVQGFRPGVDKRLGVDFETALSLNPKIVYVHGAGYGSSGPLAHRPIYAGTAAAAAGSWHRQASFWLDPELCQKMGAAECQAVVAPRMRNLTDGDANAAVAVLSATLFALRHRQRTGEGQFVGTSMIGGNVLAYSDDFNRYEGKVPVRMADAEQLGLSATHRLYEAAEGWVFFATPTQAEWGAAMQAANRRDLLSDVRFSTSQERDTYDGELAAELEALFATRTATEWEDLFVPAGVGCVAVSPLSQAETMVADHNLRSMGLVGEVDHPLFGPLLRYGPPAALSATPGRIAPGNTVAQHTASILEELGYDEDQIKKLAADGVVRLA
jgi:crotonobetainyl-CoA:carnitine CoA-transferase CaiB-like acyl-CoA transferase